MATSRRILGALLASIAADLTRLSCLDLTAARLASGLLPRSSGHADGLWDLVIADAGADVLTHCHDDTLVLLFHDGPRPSGNPRGLACASRVRTASGEWRLYTRTPRASVPPRPRLSVVIPVQDQVAELERLLVALAVEDADPPWDVWIVDRCSFDTTAAFLRGVEGSVRVLRQPRRCSFQEAVAAALTACGSPWALVLSPHWVPPLGWRQAAMDAIAKHPTAAAVHGKVLDARTGNAIAPAADPDGLPILLRLPVSSGPVVIAEGLQVRSLRPTTLEHAPRDLPATAPAAPGGA
jgi:hypothetical protein